MSDARYRPMRDAEVHLGSSRTCVVAFASGPHRFEWGRSLKGLGVSHVLVRDSTERWYQHGIEGIGTRRAVIDFMFELSTRYDRVMTLGLSAGSYGAIMYGAAAGTDDIVAISPVSGKGDALRSDFDPKWWHRIEHGPEHPPVADLKGAVRFPVTAVCAFVSDGQGTELDRRMAERVGIKDIRFVPGHSHSGLARAVRDSGILASLVGRHD